MIRMRVLGALVALSLLPGWAPRPAPETIVVHDRFNYMVCAGQCTDGDLTVRSGGAVELRVRRIHSRWEYFRYHVTPQQFAAFRAALAPVRPVGSRGPTGDCANSDYAASEGINAYVIRWRDGGPDGDLVSCIGDDVHSAFLHAYLALRIRPGFGTLMDDEEAQDFAARIP